MLADRFGPPLPGENRLGSRCRELDADEQPGPGEVVLAHDARTGQVRLELELLRQLFGG